MLKSRHKPIRVLLIITGLSTGGAEMILLKLLERIDREKFSPHVISLTDIGQLGPRIAALGIPVDALGMSRGKPDPVRFVRLVRRLRQVKPDVVHTWMYHADLIGGAAARLAGVSIVIWSIFSSGILRADTSLLTKLTVSFCARLSSWLPDCVQYDSHHGKAYHEEIGYRERCSLVIPNGVDLKEFIPNEQARYAVRQEIGIPPKTPLIGLIARFNPIKNHEGFIKAAGYLHRDMPGIHFLMVGQSVEWSNPALKKLIEVAKLSNVFHLLGCRDDVPRIMASLDLACLTSWGESFGIVLIEAMACGVPCVSTDCGEQASILGDTGWIVPLGDMEGLAAKCATFFSLPENERRLIGEAARIRVTDQFELGAMVKRYETMYLDYAK
jgi:glycosyltransferase involved in cell wall biosynthesis